jgi:alkylresorcinol/alkylpyrone synthase
MNDSTVASAPDIRAVRCALPEHYHPSEILSQALWDAWASARGGADASPQARARFERIHRAAGVRGRHLALPLEAYGDLGSFAASNAAWTRAAADLGTEAAVAALATAGLEPRDVDHVFFNTVTGIASPSIDVKLINRLGMRPDVKRTPIFGLGCVGGAAGTARAADYLRAFPGHVALLLSVELCSLTLQLHDRSIANVIATALFGDGAAAVVLGGGGRGDATGPRVVASRSLFFPDTEEVMGWAIEDTGFRVVLTGGIPDLVRRELRGAVDAFLGAHGLGRANVQHWIAHTGGPKVLRAMEETLELPADALARSWASLAAVGNVSSASVLFVAADLLAAGVARPGDVGVLLSLGPGFCGELVLLRW